MKKEKREGTSGKLLGAGVLTAVVASLCCITPVIALIAGGSGAASAFNWLEPVRPYLLGLTIAVLILAWYVKLKPRNAELDCACEEDAQQEDKAKRSFRHSKGFLAIVTVFAIAMMLFPKYSSVFYPDRKPDIAITKLSHIQTIDLQISGMSCTGCEDHIKHTASTVPGFVKAEADFKTGTATVTYDAQKASPEKIVKAIDETGYKVVRVTVEKEK